MTWNKKELLEEFKKAEICKSEGIFDYIYVLPTRRKHDSGYYQMEIYGEIIDKETEENKFYKLASFSDVIDISYILGNYSRFERPISIDFPCQGIIRFFPRYSDKIIVPYTFTSSFEIKVKDKNI